MTEILDLRVKRLRMCYSLEWDFENLIEGARSYVCSLDEEPPRLSNAAHGNITELCPFFLVAPKKYHVARILHIWICATWNTCPEGDHIILEKLKILNSPVHLPMTQEYD